MPKFVEANGITSALMPALISQQCKPDAHDQVKTLRVYAMITLCVAEWVPCSTNINDYL